MLLFGEALKEDLRQLQHAALVLLLKVSGRRNCSLAPCHHLFVHGLSTWQVLSHDSHLMPAYRLENGLL